jgi:copper(I)-binding protein
MRKVAGTLVLCTALCPFAATAEIMVEDAYVRGLPPGVANTSAYMTIRNTGDIEVVLTGAQADFAGMSMLHRTVAHDGMMHMEHVDSVSVPAHGELQLESGGLHLMLMNLKSTPVPDSQVGLTLQFGDGSTIAVTARVRSVLEE